MLGEYKSATSLKHTEPLHILIGHIITTKSGGCRPWSHLLTELLESFLLIIYQMSDILHHSLPILRDGSCPTKVDDELRRQELEPEKTQEQQEEEQEQEERTRTRRTIS